MEADGENTTGSRAAPPGGSGAPGSVRCLDLSEFDEFAPNAGGEFVWLHMREAPDTQIARVGERFGLHPLTVEDLQHFGQRAKIEDYENYLYLVIYGSAPLEDDDRLVEVHVVYASGFLITVARDESDELANLRERTDSKVMSGPQLLHAVIDVLVDSYSPLLEEVDDQIELIEDRIFARDLEGCERDIHAVRKQISRVDRIVHRQSEALTRLPEMLGGLPGTERVDAPYFRDVQDHLIRVGDWVDSLRDRVSNVSDIYLSALDTRLNRIMKQFTVIAGIFLPLTVVVGYFGQNFRWMTDRVDTAVGFVIYGALLPLAIIVVLLVVFMRRGLLKE